MVRAPCCESMGLKKGPWTPEEDRILISYIQRYGHENWRALPKQAGLLRCGKSCRLRWINYLRPDIKRGNFTKEEEDAIIQLHELLGNRWSAIAAKLPGRTDNEIKNIWHTRLKKRAKGNQKLQDSTPKKRLGDDKSTEAMKSQAIRAVIEANKYNSDPFLLSPAQSYSEISSSATSPSTSETNNNGKKDMITSTSAQSSNIEESFWMEAWSSEESSLMMDCATMFSAPASLCDSFTSFWPSSRKNDEVDFWLKVFMEPGNFNELPEI